MEYSYIVTVLGVLINAAISHTSQVITSQIGETVTIHCSLSNLDSDLKFIYWKKNGTSTVYSRTSSGETANGKYSVIGGTSLVITDVVESDAGNYYCRVVRQSLKTENSDITKLYVIAFSVSHCNDSERDVDGCSCHINGINITSLVCSAWGFPNPPIITWAWWEESEHTIGSPVVDLTRFSENVTLVCKAQDRDQDDVSANKSVCVYHSTNYGERDDDINPQRNIGPTESTPPVLKIILPLVLITLAMLILFIALWLYRRKKGIPFCGPHRTFQRTSTPQSTRALDELRYDKLQQRMKSVEDDLESVDLPTKDFNEDIIFEDAPELLFPLVGQVLLDDLRSSSEDSKKSLKAVIFRLLNKRVKPYKDFQLPMDASYASMPLNTSILQKSMKDSMIADASADKDFAFVGLVLQKLDQILDETDKDECEILITKPDFQEVTDESQIPAYQGNRVINRSIPMQNSMRSLMNRSRIACSLESSVIREELRPKTSPERTAARNVISQIILNALGTRQRANRNLLNRSTDMLQHTEDEFHGAEDLVDENSRQVALWASKMIKLDDEVNSSITEYLFPLKPRKPEEHEIGEPNIEQVKEDVEEPVKEPVKEPTEEQGKEPMEENTKGPVKELMAKTMYMTEKQMEGSDKELHDCADCSSTSSLEDSFQK